ALAADLAASLLGEEMGTDDAWMQTYGPGSTPVDDRGTYPSKAELLQKLESTCERAESLAIGASQDQLVAANETPFFPKQFPTVGDLLTHLLTTHAAMHLGQLSAWRRTVGKGSVLGI
ncbi:DinB family protein, partial [bacterium]|nr:DinB family protein [bacterium]